MTVSGTRIDSFDFSRYASHNDFDYVGSGYVIGKGSFDGTTASYTQVSGAKAADENSIVEGVGSQIQVLEQNYVSPHPTQEGKVLIQGYTNIAVFDPSADSFSVVIGDKTAYGSTYAR